MKAFRLIFATDKALQPAKGFEVAQQFKRFLVETTSLARNKTTQDERRLWKVYDDFEEHETEPITIVDEEQLKVLRRCWEEGMPQLPVGYKWKQELDRILSEAEEVEVSAN